MKTKFIYSNLVVLSVIVFISLSLFQSLAGPHGGTVRKAANFNIEMKNSYGGFYTYLLDSKLKPVKNKDITCRVKVFFADKTSIHMQLIPCGIDGFTAESMPPLFSSCIIIFHVADSNISAEFDNDLLFVKQKQRK